MRARVIMAELGIPRANIEVDGHAYVVYLRDWISPEGEVYCVLDDILQFPDPEVRKAINDALLEFQEYQSPVENPGHAD